MKSKIIKMKLPETSKTTEQQSSVENELLSKLQENVDRLYSELDKLHGAEYVNLYIELMRIVFAGEPVDE